MHIIINNSSMIPVYEQVVSAIKQSVISGELKENDALPSVRVLANELKISALTVKKAYDKLEEEGFVITVHGKGTYVAPTNQQLALEARRKEVEDDLSRVCEKAKACGITEDEIRQILEMILEE